MGNTIFAPEFAYVVPLSIKIHSQTFYSDIPEAVDIRTPELWPIAVRQVTAAIINSCCIY